MTRTLHFSRHDLPPAIRPALYAALLVLAASANAQVTPPPLPPGSAMVKVEGGMNVDERSRQVRAHHHKLHHRKNYMLDDSVDHGHSVHDRQLAPAPAVAAVTPSVIAVPQRAPATAARAPAPVPCEVNTAPARVPTAGELAALQPRAGDIAAPGAAARAPVSQAQAGCDATQAAKTPAKATATVPSTPIAAQRDARPASATPAARTSNSPTKSTQ